MTPPPDRDAVRPPVREHAHGSGRASDLSPLSRRRLLVTSAVAGAGLATFAAGADPALASGAVSPTPRGALAGVTLAGVTLTGAAWRGETLLAVGRTRTGRSGVWTRTAGQPWRKARTADTFADTFADADLAGVTAARGRLIAVGSRRTGADVVPAAWVSTDGMTWRAATLPNAGGVLTGVAASATSFLAVGARSDGETAEGAGALVLASTDGASWTRVRTHGLPVAAESALTAVVHHRGRWLVAGALVAGAGLWGSVDGVTWRAEPSPAAAGAVVSALAVHRDDLVAAGTTIAGTAPRLWRRQRKGPWVDVTAAAVPAGIAAGGVLHAVVPAGGSDHHGSMLLLGARGDRALATVTADL